LRGPDFGPRAISKAVAATVGRRLSYEEQLGILSDAIGKSAAVEPTIFALTDCHPLSALQFTGIDVSMVVPASQLSEITKRAHSPSCGRLALFWRQGANGASVTAFVEPGLVDVARALHEGALRRLGGWAGGPPKDSGATCWHGSLVRPSSPIVEAVSPVRLPSQHVRSKAG
jgi:hypothetical protein